MFSTRVCRHARHTPTRSSGPQRPTLHFGADGNDRLQGLADNDSSTAGSDSIGRSIPRRPEHDGRPGRRDGQRRGRRHRQAHQHRRHVGSDFADTFNATGFPGRRTFPARPTGRMRSKVAAVTTHHGRGHRARTSNDPGPTISSATGPVTVDLAAGTADGDAPSATTRSPTSPTMCGSAYNDTIYGSDNGLRRTSPTRAVAVTTTSTAAAVTKRDL